MSPGLPHRATLQCRYWYRQYSTERCIPRGVQGVHIQEGVYPPWYTGGAYREVYHLGYPPRETYQAIYTHGIPTLGGIPGYIHPVVYPLWEACTLCTPCGIPTMGDMYPPMYTPWVHHLRRHAGCTIPYVPGLRGILGVLYPMFLAWETGITRRVLSLFLSATGTTRRVLSSFFGRNVGNEARLISHLW